jgi:hypothetical protein
LFSRELSLCRHAVNHDQKATDKNDASSHIFSFRLKLFNEIVGDPMPALTRVQVNDPMPTLKCVGDACLSIGVIGDK